MQPGPLEPPVPIGVMGGRQGTGGGPRSLPGGRVPDDAPLWSGISALPVRC